jgi:uncharacterized membrane protein
MNEPSGRVTLRERLPLAPSREQHFHWRGVGVSRLEGLTDGVFAFAVTLLVVALEVPNTFEGLMDVVRGFPAFVICFVLLMLFWNAHFRYHRRYGLEDPLSRIVTMAILVLVLFFVYPLKYLFTMVTVNLFGLDMADPPRLESMEHLRLLYLIYGVGFGGVWGLYALLYAHALRKRADLELSEIEVVQTRASLAENLIYVGVCLLSIALAYAPTYEWVPGVSYALLGPLQSLSGWWFARRQRALISVPAAGA